MDDAHARALLRSWQIPGEQSTVYRRVLDCLRDCDLPEDLKPMLRSIAVQRWSVQIATEHASTEPVIMNPLPREHGTAESH